MLRESLNKTKLVIFVASVSIFFYVSSVAVEILDPSFTLDNDFCRDWVTTETGEDAAGNTITESNCVWFKSDLDEQMYYYNRGVKNRRYIWLIVEVLLTGVFALGIIKHIYPNSDERKNLYGDSIGVLFLGITTIGLFSSMIFSIILPAPAKYMRFITYELDKWEEDIKQQIINKKIYINYKGEIIKNNKDNQK